MYSEEENKEQEQINGYFKLVVILCKVNVDGIYVIEIVFISQFVVVVKFEVVKVF